MKFLVFCVFGAKVFCSVMHIVLGHSYKLFLEDSGGPEKNF